MEERLVAADRLTTMGTLVAGVAHEINNPLAVVLSGIEYACKSLDDAAQRGLCVPDEAREALRDARDGAERMRAIVKDIRTLSRAEDEARGPVDVSVVLESSIRLAWSEIRQRARLVRRFDEVPAVHGNEARLGQVFLNLLVNASQAIEHGSVDDNEVRVSAWLHPSGRVAVEVSDTGCGLAPSVREQIFAPFFTTKPAGAGLGLGLAICRRIVEGYGGAIEVESEPGLGATFRVLLPRADDADGVGLPALSGGPPTAPQQRTRALVIDDEPAIGMVIRRALEPQCDVRATTRAEEALAWLLGGERFDVIFCDLMMPGMGGVEFYEALGASAPELRGQVVITTGGACSDRTRRFLDEVGVVRIEKPFDARLLRRVVAERVAASR